MSNYSHDMMKYADTGLQLRLPVDLVPPTQYSRLTNALPIIEGELRTRDGLTLIGTPIRTAYIWKISPTSVAFSVYPHGFYFGQQLTFNLIYNDPTQSSALVTGSYTVTINGFLTPYTFAFTPNIPVASGSPPFYIFAQVVSAVPLNSLSGTEIDTIFRLNEAVTALNGDRLAVINGRVWHASLPAGTDFEELVAPLVPGAAVPTATMGLSGRPVSIIGFRFTKDSASWAIIADQNAMLKYRPGLTDAEIEFVPLGNQPPTVAATASAGGTGNLNSTGGTGYDWRYTFVDGLAQTESNPSPINMSSGGTSTTRPTSYTNPAVAGDQSFDTPANAYDGSLTTGSQGGAASSAYGSGGTVTQSASCLWKGWAQPAGTVTSTILNVTADIAMSTSNDGAGFSSASATLSYSYDGGVTYQTLKTVNLSGGTQSSDTGTQTYTATIPSSAAYANIYVKAIGHTSARGAHIGDDDYGADSSVTVIVYDINTTVTQSGSVNTLALVDKIGVVCVKASPYAQHKFINLYRRGGSLPDAWRLVGQFQVSTLSQGTCGAGTLEIDDNVSDTTLSTSTILQLDNDPPITSVTKLNQPLPFIWGPIGLDVRVLGVGDPARPESVYFSKPGNADAWPPQNYVEVSDPGTPLIAGCAFNTRTFVFSRESIFELVEGLGTGTTYTPFRTPSSRGLFTPWGLAVGPAMYFVAKDGIYQSTGGQETSLVENDIKPLFPTYDSPGQSVHGYEAVDMSKPDNIRLRFHNDELYFSYSGADTGTRQMLIYDTLKNRWRGMTCSCGISEVYSEPNVTSSLLYGTSTGLIYQAGGDLDPSDFDIIENMGFGAVAATTTFNPATYYARAVRYTTAGAVAISDESALNLSSSIGIQAAFPVAAPDTSYWRVFYGTQPGQQTVYQEYSEASLTGSRTVIITSVTGSTGALPTVNANQEITAIVRTGAHDQKAPFNLKQYGNVLFDIDPGGATNAAPVTITPYINGEAAAEASLTVTGSGRQQFPLDLQDYFALNTEYETRWTRTILGDGSVTDPVLFQYDTLYFIDPVGVTNWTAQPTSFGFPGYVHVRDIYIALRSTTTVRLTVKVDSTQTLTYDIPSTNGERLKRYVQLDPNKGLMYQFSLSSAAFGDVHFQVYEEDLEVRVKPWLGVLGYAVLRPLGGEVSV